MKTMRNEHSRDAAYFGENGHWLIAATVHRDSGELDQSNFETMQAALKALPAVKDFDGEFTPVQVERSSHWAVGWVDYLIVNPECSEAVALAEEMRARLEDYPILDEEDFSRREMESANDTWRDCYNMRERVKYIRSHRSQFEFHDFADMLGCVRGNYFSGYASELLH